MAFFEQGIFSDCGISLILFEADIKKNIENSPRFMKNRNRGAV